MSVIVEPKDQDRRQCFRHRLLPMYTPVTVQQLEDLKIDRLEGHAYDISETGVRIELDEPIDVGRTVGLQIRLPGQTTEVFVAGEVVWVNDADDDPGPRRLALRFTDFLTEGDRTRLLAFMGEHVERIAA